MADSACEIVQNWVIVDRLACLSLSILMAIFQVNLS